MKCLVPLLAVSLPLAAGRIDVTGWDEVTLRSGTSLVAEIGVWLYAAGNRGISPYPTGVWLTLTGLRPSGVPVPLPNSSEVYFPGFLLDASLESLDGTVSVPFRDLSAEALGLAQGRLVVMPASVSAGGDPLERAGFSAWLRLSPEISEALFGDAVSRRWMPGARVRLKNFGESYTLAFAPGYHVPNALAVSLSNADSSYGAGAYIHQVLLENPEPSTIMLFGAGLGVLALGAARTLSRKARPPLRGAP